MQRKAGLYLALTTAAYSGAMEMGINPGSAPFGVHDSALTAEPVDRSFRPLDWQGLRSRLAASHAARAAFLADREQDPVASFDSVSARALDAYPGGSTAVNPNASFVVKRNGGNHGDVAGGPITGDRGPR